MAVVKSQVKNFSCSTKIQRENYKFSIHTGNVVDRNVIISEIFKEGQYVSKRLLDYHVREDSDAIRYDYLSEMTRRFHMEIAEKLEALFTISRKIRKKGTVHAHYQLAVIFMNMQFIDEAEKHFKQAIKLDPSFIRAHYGLAIIKLHKQDYKKALLLLRNCQDTANTFPDFHNLMGVIHLFMEDYQRAIGEFKKAIELNPKYIEGQLNLGIGIYFNAMQGIENDKSIGIPARISLFMKQLQAKKKYDSIRWKQRFKEILEIIKSGNHRVLQEELKKFLLETTNLSSEKDKIYEFFLRFIYGGKEMTLDTLKEYEEVFKKLMKDFNSYPDVWNDIAVFQLIKSRIYLLKALSAFQKSSGSTMDGGEGKRNYDLIRSKEKGFLLLLRALLKNSSM
jgi:tetratricopeptide (TPR) repeat protein